MFPAVLLQVIVILLIAGILLWGLEHIPLDPTIRGFIRVAVIVVIAIWLVMLLASMMGYPLVRATPRRAPFADLTCYTYRHETPDSFSPLWRFSPRAIHAGRNADFQFHGR